MAYKTDPIDRDFLRGVLRSAEHRLNIDGEGRGALTQAEILDLVRGPLEYREETLVDEGTGETIYAKGDVIPRPHQDLEALLREMKLANTAYFDRQRGGWRLR